MARKILDVLIEEAEKEDTAPGPALTLVPDVPAEPEPTAEAEAEADVEADVEVSEPAGDTAAKAAEKPKRERRPRTPAGERAQPKPDAPVLPAGPAYLTFERKETRLREDQYSALTIHARRLNKLKGKGGERITENTLIRVAIDMLLSRADDLRGVDEDALRQSMGL